jgi:hypothetical protein
MLGSGGGGGLPPAWPHISGAILERRGFGEIHNKELMHASNRKKGTILMHNIHPWQPYITCSNNHA